MGDISYLNTYFADRLPDIPDSTLSSKVEDRLPAIVSSILVITEALNSHSEAQNSDMIFNKKFTEEFNRCYGVGKGTVDIKTWAEEWFVNSPPADFVVQFSQFYGLKNFLKLTSIESRFRDLLDPVFPVSNSSTFEDLMISYGFAPNDIKLIYQDFPKPPSTLKRDIMCLILSAIIFQSLRSRRNPMVVASPVKVYKNNSVAQETVFDTKNVADPKDLIKLFSKMGLPEKGGSTRSGKTLRYEDESESGSDSEEDTEQGSVDEDDTSKAKSTYTKKSSKHSKGNNDLNLLKFLSPAILSSLGKSQREMASLIGSTPNLESLNSYNWWEVGEKLPNELESMRNTYTKVRELNEQDVRDLLKSENGLIMADVEGRALQIKMRKIKDATTGELVAVLWNPDDHAALARMGKHNSSKHIYPTTAPLLLQFISQQMISCHEKSAFAFKESTDQEKHSQLNDFNRMIISLLDKLNLMQSGGQNDPLHVTSMALVTVFFVNRWMRSMVAKDLSLLTLEFDNHWMSKYDRRVRIEANRIAPRMGFEISLLILGYFCKKCLTRGSYMSLCCIKCGFDTTLKGGVDNGTNKSKIRLSSDAFNTFMAWKKADAKRKNVSIEKYISSENITQGLITSANTPTVSSNSLVGDVFDRTASDQRQVQLHRCDYTF